MKKTTKSDSIPTQVPDRSDVPPDNTSTITPLNRFFQIGYILALVVFSLGALLSWFSVVSIYVLLCIPVGAALYSAWQASKSQDWPLFASILTCLLSLTLLFILKH